MYASCLCIINSYDQTWWCICACGIAGGWHGEAARAVLDGVKFEIAKAATSAKTVGDGLKRHPET
jgi:hypothetical protein